MDIQSDRNESARVAQCSLGPGISFEWVLEHSLALEIQLLSDVRERTGLLKPPSSVGQAICPRPWPAALPFYREHHAVESES